MHNTDMEKIRAEEERIKERFMKIKNVIVVLSGKGGVGKTSVSVNLAFALSSKNKVGIFDADIHGPNVAKMLGVGDKVLIQTQDGLEPVWVNSNLQAVSLALTGRDESHPYIWRGPMKSAVIRQLLAQSDWEDLDYLIIDTPPGTGDEALSVLQLIPNVTGAVVVTTPQEVALLDTKKSINFLKNMKVKILGTIENMSGFICPKCGEETAIFKKDSLENLSDFFGVDFLGAIPFDFNFMQGCDSGTVGHTQAYSGPAGLAYLKIADKIVEITKEKN